MITLWVRIVIQAIVVIYLQPNGSNEGEYL